MKRVLAFAFCLLGLSLVAQVIYQPHRRNAFRATTVAAFQPSDVAGLVMWFDASAITSPTNSVGYLVTNWWDRSSSHYMLYNAGNGQQPYYTNNVSRLNGKPWLEFDGTDDRLLMATTQLYSQSNVIFCAFISRSGAATLYVCDSTNSSYRNAILLNASGSFRIEIRAPTLLNGVFASNQWYLAECTFTNGGSSILTNGVSVIAGDAGVNPMSGLMMGARYDASTFLKGGIAEFLFYNGPISSADLIKIRTYFTNKYGAFASW